MLRNKQIVHMNVNFLNNPFRWTRLNAKEITCNSSFALLWSPYVKQTPDFEQISQPLHVSIILMVNGNTCFLGIHDTLQRLAAIISVFLGN